MTQRSCSHVVRDSRGELVATLRCLLDQHSACFEWLDGAGVRVLVAEVKGPGATRLLDGLGREITCETEGESKSAIRLTGSTGVVRSSEIAGRPIWIVDDYGNQSRHVVLGCRPDCFLHVHLDNTAVTLTEKSRQHATLRTVRYDATHVLLADEAVVQPGESIADVARRCGVAPEVLSDRADSPTATLAAGTVVRLL